MYLAILIHYLGIVDLTDIYHLCRSKTLRASRLQRWEIMMIGARTS